MRSSPAFLATALLVAACGDDDPIDCDTAADCSQAGIAGSCLPSPVSDKMWCAFPDNGCDSGESWGILSGDGLARMCVDDVPDGGIDAPVADAGVDASADADVDAMPPMLSQKVFLPSTNLDIVYVYDPGSLAALASITLPDRDSVGSGKPSLGGNRLWIPSLADVVSIDPATSLVDGSPVHLETLTSCTVQNAFFTAAGMYCTFDAVGTTSDAVRLLTGGTLTTQSGSHKVPSPLRVRGNASRLLASYGDDDKTIAVLDPTLTPVAGSPIIAAVDGAVSIFGVDDIQGVIAVVGGTTIQLFDRGTLSLIGTKVFAVAVSGITFDPARSRIVVSLADGSVGAFTPNASFTEQLAFASRATEVIHSPTFDGTRDRIFALTPTRLLVLDAATLDHVAGSPVTIPGAASGLAIY